MFHFAGTRQALRCEKILKNTAKNQKYTFYRGLKYFHHNFK